MVCVIPNSSDSSIHAQGADPTPATIRRQSQATQLDDLQPLHGGVQHGVRTDTGCERREDRVHRGDEERKDHLEAGSQPSHRAGRGPPEAGLRLRHGRSVPLLVVNRRPRAAVEPIGLGVESRDGSVRWSGPPCRSTGEARRPRIGSLRPGGHLPRQTGEGCPADSLQTTFWLEAVHPRQSDARRGHVWPSRTLRQIRTRGEKRRLQPRVHS